MKNSPAGIPNKKSRDKSIIAYFDSGQPLQFKRGDTIVNELDEPSGIHLIKAGFVKAVRPSQAGHKNLLFIHQEGELIPLPWALDELSDPETGLSYEAMSDVTTMRIPKSELRKALGRDAWLSQEILKQAVDTIAVYTQRIQTLEFRTARGRIVSELLNLSQRFGENYGNRITVNVPMTHQDLADSINMNRETASRALSSLVEEGLISQTGHLINILDLPKLREALD